MSCSSQDIWQLTSSGIAYHLYSGCGGSLWNLGTGASSKKVYPGDPYGKSSYFYWAYCKLQSQIMENYQEICFESSPRKVESNLSKYSRFLTFLSSLPLGPHIQDTSFAVLPKWMRCKNVHSEVQTLWNFPSSKSSFSTATIFRLWLRQDKHCQHYTVENILPQNHWMQPWT